MPRKKIGINQTRCKRLNERMAEKGVTQYALAKETGIKQQNLSAMMNGKSNVSENAAKKISKALDCRYQWLLGHDDFKTNSDMVMHFVSEAKGLRNKEQTLFVILAEMNGWKILDSVIKFDMQGAPIIGDCSESYARISDGETTLNFGKVDFTLLVNRISDYFTFELEHIDPELIEE